MHACLQFLLLPWVCMNARGLGGWLIYLGLSSFSRLNLYSKACGTISKGWLLKKYLWKEERNILGTERKVLYSVIHKLSKIPVAWQEKMFLLLFYFFLSISLLISILVGCFRDHIAIILNSLIANGRVWFVQVFYFCKLVVSLILHILKQ